MPSATHDEASGFWVQNVTLALAALVPNGLHWSTPVGCKFIGTRSMFFSGIKIELGLPFSFQPISWGGERRKQMLLSDQPTATHRIPVLSLK